jgi:formate C-acetyltransferase
VRLHPSAIGESIQARRKYVSLIKTYFSLGGEQLQPTVASTEMLRAAQKDPGSYRGLIVKVGGYSAYFVDLGIEIQNEIISRSEHRMGA